MRHALALLLFGFALHSQGQAAEKPTVIDLWPGVAPGEPAGEGAKLSAEAEQPVQPGQRVVRRVSNVSRPTLTMFAPPKGQANGTAVVIAPGGGYNILAWDLEGEEVADWLTKAGVTAFVLKYRVPRRSDDAKDAAPKVALIDAQRAMRLVRGRAKEWGLEPSRVGMLGFSAGGHLTVATCTNSETPLYAKVDAADEGTSRPDFAVLVYPAYLIDPKQPEPWKASLPITAKTPPMFLAHAYDDPVSPENSLHLALELKRAKVPCELHLYSGGGHGFGLRPAGPNTTWPKRCEEWMAAMKLLK